MPEAVFGLPRANRTTSIARSSGGAMALTQTGVETVLPGMIVRLPPGLMLGPTIKVDCTFSMNWPGQVKSCYIRLRYGGVAGDLLAQWTVGDSGDSTAGVATAIISSASYQVTTVPGLYVLTYLPNNASNTVWTARLGLAVSP